MPIKHAAIKALRQNLKARDRNLAVKLNLKKLQVKLRKAYTAKNAAEAKALTMQLVKAYDKAAQKKVVHRNTASRKKSRLLARLAKSV